jgi:hypothetical protein
MRRSLLKAAFTVTVLFLMLILLIPATVALEALFPTVRGPSGHYRSGDRLLPGIVALFACLWSADRMTSVLFKSARLSEERWSLLKSRRARRSP